MSKRQMNSELIFRGQAHRRTAPFRQRRSGGRIHKGVDYGTFGVAAIQYCPLDGGIVHNVVTAEKVGRERGLLVDVRWQEHDLGMILQHGRDVLVATGDIVNEGQPLITTGMTGLNRDGRRVSTGVHAHVELYRISTQERLDFETFDFASLREEEDMVRYETLNDVPTWGQVAVRSAMEKEGIDGKRVLTGVNDDGDEDITNDKINLTSTLLRTIVMNYRLGLYR